VRGITLSSKPHGVLRGYIKERNINESFDVKKASCLIVVCFAFLFASVQCSCFCKFLKKGVILTWVVLCMRLVGYVRTSSGERDGGGQEFSI